MKIFYYCPDLDLSGVMDETELEGLMQALLEDDDRFYHVLALHLAMHLHGEPEQVINARHRRWRQ